MRKTIFICDRCGKEVKGDVIQLGNRTLENESGGEMYRNWGAELCQDCYKEISDMTTWMGEHPDVHFSGGIIKYGQEAPPEPAPEEPVKEDPPKANKAERIRQSKVRGGQNRKKDLDLGKMGALLRAGWKIKDIAAELHCSETTVYNRQQEALDFLDRQNANADFEEAEEDL